MRSWTEDKCIRSHAAKLGVVLLFCALFLVACNQQAAAELPLAAPAERSHDSVPKRERAAAVEQKDDMTRMLLSMSLREKVGQLFIVRPDDLNASVRRLTDDGRALYEQYPAGGFCLFSQNVSDPQQLQEFTSALHSLGGLVRPILAIDEEGGRIVRIASNRRFDVPLFPNMGRLASGKDLEIRCEAAFEASRQIGSYLKEYGIDVDFAPVADVNTNPRNPVIGLRAFSSDPEEAAAMVASAVQGFHESGMLCCLKHWPGHGDTKTDTHKGSSSTARTWEDMLSCELLPFASGIASGADMVMVSHIAAEAVTGSNEPASLSYILMTEKLRGELGFQGVIITDAFDMKAISATHSSGEAAVQAILAGADIVLMPADYEEAFDAVVAAVECGEISEDRLLESLRRILRLKAALGEN